MKELTLLETSLWRLLREVDSNKQELLTLDCEFEYNEELHNYIFTVIYAKDSIRLFLRLFMALSCCAAVL